MVQARGTILLGTLLMLSLSGTGGRAAETDLAGIERLHQQDIAATVPGDPKLLAETWTEDAVRINPDGRANVGRAAIRAADERASVRHPRGRVVTYVPVIQDLRIAGEWAFEWGTFTASYNDTPAGEVHAVRGTVLRVLRKQSDGAWKFARVMTQVDSR